MARKSNSISDVFILIGAFVGITLLVWVVWLISLFVLAGLIYAGLSLFTDWDWGSKLFWGVLSSFLCLKFFGGLVNLLDILGIGFPDSKGKKREMPVEAKPVEVEADE